MLSEELRALGVVEVHDAPARVRSVLLKQWSTNKTFLVRVSWPDIRLVVFERIANLRIKKPPTVRRAAMALATQGLGALEPWTPVRPLAGVGFKPGVVCFGSHALRQLDAGTISPVEAFFSTAFKPGSISIVARAPIVRAPVLAPQCALGTVFRELDEYADANLMAYVGWSAPASS